MDPSKSSNHWNELKLSVLIPAILSALVLVVTWSFYSPSWEILLVGFALGIYVVVRTYQGFERLVRWQIEEQSSSFYIPSWYGIMSSLIFMLGIASVYLSFHLDPTTTSLASIINVKFTAISFMGMIVVNICHWAVVKRFVRKNWRDVKMDYLSEIGER